MNSWLCYIDFITDRVGLLGATEMRATLHTGAEAVTSLVHNLKNGCLLKQYHMSKSVSL